MRRFLAQARQRLPRPFDAAAVTRPTPLPRTDGGQPSSGEADADETAFVWGPTRGSAEGTAGGDEATGDDGEATPLEGHLDAIEGELTELAETAEHVSLQATNADLKLARREYEALPPYVYEIESDARSLQRAVDDLRARVEDLRRTLDAGAADEEADTHRPASGDDSARNDDGSTAGRSSTAFSDDHGGSQAPEKLLGDPGIPGPRRVAGVDLARWPGHLATMDFERAKEQVPRTETVAAGGVPRDVARFTLDEGELSFEALLALAAGRDSRPAGDDVGADGDR